MGLRVGQLTMSSYLLITFRHLLDDSSEYVVFETINTLYKLLQFGLLSKDDSLEYLDIILRFLQ